MSTAIPSKVLLLTLLVPLVAFVAWLIYHETRTPRNQGEVLNRMIELQEEGRYDKAVQVVQNWMKDARRNTSNDGFMYGQIAIVYIAKAYKKPATRDESIRRAEENLQKELTLFDRQSQTDLNLDRFEIGSGYEILGDFSDKDKCRLYERARELFERQLPLIKGDSYTAYGHTTPLEPVRNDVRKHLNAVNEKSTKTGCREHSEQ
jgi:tetratricopeptide (TPR) repeat protein